MADNGPIYSADMRGVEGAAMKYELPLILGAAVAGAVLAVAYALIVRRVDPYWVTNFPLYFMGALVLIGMVAVFWAASYFAKRVDIYPDRLVFKMVFSSREVPFSNITGIALLTEEETRKTFLRPGSANLSPAVGGSVMMTRVSGRPWVFSLVDPVGFIEEFEKAKSSGPVD